MKYSVEKTEFHTDGFDSRFYAPRTGSERCLVIVTDSGSGDFMNVMLAKWALRNGCCALCFGKWQNPEEADGLHEWPLERMERAAAWLQERGMRRIGLLGVSYGANLVLAAASRIPAFTLTIAVTAIDFVTEGVVAGKKEGMSEWPAGVSSYTWRGEPLAYHPFSLSEHAYYDLFVESSKREREPRSFEIYRHMEEKAPAPECYIPVERIQGKLILAAARDDSMWDAARYAQRMRERLAASDCSCEYEVCIYRYGTHFLFPQSALQKVLPLVGGLLPALTRSGRRHGRECRESRKELEHTLLEALHRW
ncbi:MAG: acyl-CoA thioester hydrolase/BAAT C-terminal domain-containing protein [Eubacteriales bacterium]|nr:acyl-CoA thioester hydrolase/BAAT C-terminal domain-containing protein [Eubacteriales bacterium]